MYRKSSLLKILSLCFLVLLMDESSLKAQDSNLVNSDSLSNEIVIPENTEISLGGVYRADLKFKKYDGNEKPLVLLGNPGVNYDKTARDFDGNFSTIDYSFHNQVRLTSHTIGPQHREGIVIYTSSGVPTDTVDFELDFNVIAPSILASNRMHVLYRGIENPITLFVPGYSFEDLRPEVSNGSIRKNDDGWSVYPGKDGKAVVTCFVNLPDGSSKYISSVEFGVKNLPDPMASFSGKESKDSSIKKGSLLAASGVRARLRDFNYESIHFSVQSFTLVLITDGEVMEQKSYGAKLTKSMKAMLKKAKIGDRVIIENIKAIGPDGVPRRLGVLSFRVG